MDQVISAPLLERARDAATQGDWQQAYDLLVEADTSSPLAGSALSLLADAAYASGHLDVTIDTWERAHTDSRGGGDALAAANAAVRVAFHLLIDTALLAPVRGWLKRAERLLEDQGETHVHAWFSVVRNYERLLSGDFQAARLWAERAIQLGAVHAPAAAAIGRVALARSLILEGDVERGLALLEEAAVATLTGELDPLSTGLVYCEVVCALQGAAQYDLAEEWTQAMQRWRRGRPVGSIHGRCRVHRAEILRLRGCCAEAEQEALMACEELRPYLRRELGWPLSELGRIRFRQGDIQGAEAAFLEAHGLGWDAQPGLALVQLARGEVARAAASIREALDHGSTVPSKELPPNTGLRRAPLLEAQVEIEIAAGDVARARMAADELGRVAASFRSNALAAAAALANGRVCLAERDSAGARHALETAVQQWSDVGAPYETAVARTCLADALAADGKPERALLELRVARTTFERIGARQNTRAAPAYAELDVELPGAPAQASSARRAPASDASLFCREGDYWLLVFEGRTARLRDSKGLRYVAQLLAEPGRELSVLDLVALQRTGPDHGSDSVEPASSVADEGDAGQLLDARAKDAYRRRLTEIDADVEEALAMGDSFRTSQAQQERDFLLRELARAVGLGGRDRRASSASERARSAVTRAVRQALTRVRQRHPALGEHLEHCVRTGSCCVYLPDPGRALTWKL